MTNIIDIKKLPVREGKTSDTYLTLSQEGDLTRTTIVIPEGGNTDNVDLTDYYTKSEVDNLISNIEIPEGGTTGGVTEEWVEANYVNKERIGIIGSVKKYTTKAYYYNDSGEPVYLVYEEVTTTDVRNRNIEVYNKYIEGKIDVLFYKEYKDIEITTSYNAELGKDVTYETPKFVTYPTFSQLNDDAVEFMYYEISTYNGETTTSTMTKKLTNKGTIGNLLLFEDADIKMLSINLDDTKKKLKTNDFDLSAEKAIVLEISGTNEMNYTYNRKVILNYFHQDGVDGYYKWWGFFNENTIISYEFTQEDKNNGVQLSPIFTTINSGGAEGGAGKGLVQGAYTNYYQDSAMVQLLASNHLGRDTVEEAYNNNRVLYVGVTDNPSGYPSTKKYIPVTIEAHYNADARVTGYTVWGWYSKTQTITWEIDDTVNSVWGTIE